jgi:IS5 family transposase
MKKDNIFGKVKIRLNIFALSMKTIDKNTILTTIFTIVDESLQDPKIAKFLHRSSGPSPEMADSEVITVAIYEELIGDPREDHFYRLQAENIRPYFPNLLERSRYNRRKRDLWKVILAVRTGLLIMLKSSLEEIGIIDSAPVPVVAYKRDKKHTDFTTAGYGRCSSKAVRYFGYKLHTVVSLCGIVLDFLLAAANHHDSQAVEELLGIQTHLQFVLGDKAYWIPEIMNYLREQRNLILIASKKDNQKQTVGERIYSKQHNRIRLMVETVNAQLQEQMHLSKHYAKTTGGLFARIAAKVTAHTIGILINLFLGRPKLALASLAV